MNNRNDWHTISAEDTAKLLDVNPYRGLSKKEVKRRRSKAGRNHIWYVRRMETGRYILSTAGDLSTVLLLITAILAFVFEERASAVTMCIILAIGAALRIITYIKAKRILEDNARENIPTAALLRDGTVSLTSSRDIVPGDIILLRQGDTVPCDGRVISEGEALVSESGITENREQVVKFNTVITAGPGSAEIPCESRPNILYAGSTVLQGDIRMIAVATGEDTLISRKQGGIEIPAGDDLPLIRRLNGQCRLSELFMLAFVVIISALSLFMGTGLEQVFFCAVSMAAASMSEYLTAIGSIIIAIAARSKKGRRNSGALIKDCTKLETIAAADSVILSDLSMLKSGDVSFNSFFAGGKLHKKETLAEHTDEMRELLTLASEASGSWVDNSALSAAGSADTEGNATEREVILRQASVLFTEQTKTTVRSHSLVIDRVPGTAAMAAGIDTAILQKGMEENSAYIAALSDVQRILACCTTYRTADGEAPLTDEIRRTIFTETARLEFFGAKVLAVATRPSPFLTLNKIATLLTGMCFIGFFSLSETAAEGSGTLVRQIKEAGMRFVLLSEHAEHDLYYGHDLGLFDKKTKIVPWNDAGLDRYKGEKSLIVTVPAYHHNSTAEDLSVSAARYKVVRALGGEHTVFLTKEAFDARAAGSVGCSIAVSHSESKAISQSLKNKAQIVVYPRAAEEHGGFTEGLHAVKEARRAMLNIANATAYLAVSQAARLLVMLASVIFASPMPSSAAILIGGLILDFGAVLVMAFEKAPANALSLPCSPLPRFRARLRPLAIFGLLAAILPVLMPPLMTGIAPLCHVHALRPKESLTLLIASMFLVQAALAVQFMKREPILRRGTVPDYATLAYVAGTVIFSALLLFEKGTASLLGGTSVPWYAALLALLPAFAVFFTAEIMKRPQMMKVLRKGKKKGNNSH